MSSDVQEIEEAIQTLPRKEVERLREWIENFLEDQLEMTDQFEASIERGKKDLADGNIRVREPDKA
jgi:(p)ppGpp synthase/HD superfamily hydrolase